MDTDWERYLNRRWYGAGPIWLFVPLAWLFGVAVRIRRLWQTRFRARVLPVPVIVVGNITVGGSGKTPLVIWLADALRQAGYHPGIVTRGYGGKLKRACWVTPSSDPDRCGDEALLLTRRSQCPVVAGPDRVSAARLLISDAEEKGLAVDLIISDDGLQHYRMSRDVEVVAIDSVRGFGNGWLLPAGPLREPASRLRLADCVVLKGEGTAVVPGRRHCRMHLRLADAVNLETGERRSLGSFRDQPVVAVAGIADPEIFFSGLEELGMSICRIPLPDHASRRKFYGHLPREKTVFVTEKDAVKLAGKGLKAVWQVPLELVFSANDEQDLLSAVKHKLGRYQPENEEGASWI